MPTPKKQIKKEPSPSKKRSSKKSSLDTEADISSAEQLTVHQLIAQTLLRYKHEQLQDKKHKFREIGHLVGMCEEYLSSFALIGYSLEGEKVVVFNHSTSKDEAAITDLFRSTFIGLMGGN